ncbi:phospholipase D-like domain-containing protein [Methanoregula sp.]|uniref:phospholipase D-like domain-containing protein n=1 Tax=Methanoregula sp. TaxID=2052170 RepID=UPI00356A788D
MGIFRTSRDGLFVTAYAGDRAILLAFNLIEDKTDGLAGFSIAVAGPGQKPDPDKPYYLSNRLNFADKVTAGTPYNADLWTPTDVAPFQSFHWTHYPSQGFGTYTYTVTARYFSKGTSLKPGPSVDVAVDLLPPAEATLELGFTRTMISSQAYANTFKNAPLHPEPQTISFDTAKYQKQYAWLGAHAREMIVAFLDTCTKNTKTTLDVFAFDFNEPDVISSLCGLGKRARVFQDNSASHAWPESEAEDMRRSPLKTDTKPPLEPDTVLALRAAGVEVKTGHFSGLAHDKVMIRRRNGDAEAVLTGSANFTLRGLYVQANSVLVFEEPKVAGLYAQAFDQAWNAPVKFKSSPIATGWHDLMLGGVRYSFSFAPHKEPFPLDTIREAIGSAKQSVLFAMMQMRGSGDAIGALEDLPSREDLFSMGIIQNKGDITLFKPDTGNENFTLASSAFLAKNVPPPFNKEIRGGAGQVIHHKMVICDFNGENPVVFCGSSNLAAGGETSNGDNLMAIYDPDIAVRYAVEAIRLYDHFRFRSLQEGSTGKTPLQLKKTADWARPYYDPGSIRYRERLALAGSPK